MWDRPPGLSAADVCGAGERRSKFPRPMNDDARRRRLLPRNPRALWGSQSYLQPAFSRLLEFLHFSGISSADQGLIGDLETEWSE